MSHPSSEKDGSSAADASSQSRVDGKQWKREIKRRLRREALLEIRPLAVGTLAMIGSALCNQAVPRLLGRLLDGHTSSSSSSCASGTCTLSPSGSGGKSTMSSLAVVVLGGGVASFLRTVCLNRAQDRIAARLRTQLFGALLTHRDLEFYQSSSSGGGDNSSGGEGANTAEEDGFGKDEDEDAKEGNEKNKKNNESPADATIVATSPGAIGSVLADDVGKVSEILTTALANTIRSACSVSFATLNMIRINPSLLGLSVSVVPLIGSAAVVLNKFVKKVSAKQSEVKAQAASFAEERISHIATVKTSCREADEVAQYDQLQLEAARLGRAVSLAKGTFMGFMFAASSGALFLVFQTGGKAVSAGRMTSGQLTSFATYTFLLGLGTSGIMKASSEMAQGIVCAGRMYGLMDGNKTSEDKAEPKSVSGTGDIDPATVDSISLDDVSFAYRSNPSKNVLQGVSLKVERGKVIALLGQNGSGKSTAASLLSALYRPQSGTVRTSDGTDLYSLTRRAQSHLVQAVAQHPAFFDMSVRDNVAYTNPDATEEEVKEALANANCNGFLSKLESGTNYNYRVGRNGSKLSGGQRQRLALARALLSDPCCLVLDEPTSSLDAEGETAVADAVQACRKQKRGLLLITHRAKTLELCDEVVVLQDGEIIERGSYQNLKSNKESALCSLMPDLL
mmetsp:Transcript_13364/g.38114  ORF Transcript_13364/g.38114 Transcript_13364/m.38114 type:complete len:680 (-) Transcript_13364:104-2143(-)|eukprot:CAMPEP_0181043398 /NCGR_PEP_ID=MMETSP1070-20121207/12687_1 /TAXON_ID=265543 /ORGANISM="Minutocellus polymorphus, Strain NH13" /LENGTH=679 /DNA_ID=CAMNT_0023121725 /DNA_START=327 /DNA_END=2366 /DNA_ORIENTATION=+